MAGVRTLPKLTGTDIDPQISQWAAQIVDTLNPALRELAIATDFRWREVDGANGAAPTFVLQLAQGFGWTTIAQFDVSGRLVQPAWIAPSLLNGYAVGFPGTFLPPGYLNDVTGRVHLRGIVSNAAGRAAGAANPILVLPAGYRPRAQVLFVVNGDAGPARLDIDAAGNVFPQTVVAAGGFRSLDGISFDTRA